MFAVLPHASAEDDIAASQLVINPIGGLPGLFSNGVEFRWVVPGDRNASRLLQQMQYDVVDDGTGTGERRTLTSREPVNGHYLTHHYVLTPAGAYLDLDLPPGAAIELSGQPDFVPQSLPGFGAFYTRVLPVVVDGDGQQTLESDEELSAGLKLDAGSWFGIRNRFQARLLRSDNSILEIRVDTTEKNLPRVTAVPTGGGSRLALEVYAGPVESQSLSAVDANLSGMLYAALWNWLRLLCFGMSWLLTSLYSLLGNVGLSIILLSVCVKVLMSPLTMLAERWQDSVHKTMAILQPKIDAIKNAHKGEDAHKRILAVYKEHNVSPLYPVKSAAGFLIQIPIFIAAFDMLGESTLLDQSRFLWMADLARPDHALLLPWELPFFGDYLNLLPFLMTGITLLSSWVQTDRSLTPELLYRQRVRLSLMAGAFFVLFYTFPAGMVLYWTTNNVLHLLKIQIVRIRTRHLT